MKTFLKLAVIAALAVIPAIASAGVADIFVSFSDFGDGGAATNTMNMNLQVGDSGTAFIWVNESFQIDTGAFLDITNTDTDVIALTGATIFNPDIVVDGTDIAVDTRWQSTGISSSGSGITAGFIDELNAFSVNEGTGILPGQAIGGDLQFEDTGHDPSSSAFLFAAIDFEVLGEGSADIFLLGGEGLIVDQGNELNPIFGSANVLVLPSQVPEPTSALILIAGAAGMVARRRR